MSVRRLAAVLATLAAAGCGGGGDSAGKLAWKGEPRVLRPPTLPDDRVLRGTVTNESLRVVEVDAADVHVVDSEGERIDASAVFLAGYVKPLESRNRPSLETEGERRRRGLEVRLEPGKSAPLTVSWRQAGSERPERIDYGSGSLPLP